MKFERVIGKLDKDLVEDARKRLSKVFLDLGLRPGNEHIGSALGGDPLIFCLLHPMQHIATQNIPTAATDGKRYYWNPKFVCSKSKIGLRMVCAHEAWHAIYMHPQRRGSRKPKLWNYAVDFIVNWTVMMDLKNRKQDPVAMFKKELGNFITLEAYAKYLENPYQKIEGSEDWINHVDGKFDDNGEIFTPSQVENDKELTEEEQKALDKKAENKRYFFADPDLPKDLRKPEKIYEYLLSKIPKCPECGALYYYEDVKPKDHKCEDKGCCDVHPCCDKCKPCDEHRHCKTCKQCHDCDCGEDPMGIGGTMDDHMDADDSPEKMARRLAEGIEAAKRMAGSIPGELEDEIGKLLAPKVRWQDSIRAKLLKTKHGNSKNDYTSYRSRPLFAGLMIPKKTSKVARFGCLLDTSGSMSKDDMTYGISQLQSIDVDSEGWIVPADAQIYWKASTKIKKVTQDQIQQIKIIGRGGTRYAEFFRDYEKEMGKVDFLIMITDGYLDMSDIADMVNPGIDVFWIITSACDFTPPFGRVFDLKSI